MSRACRPCRREPPSSSSGAASPAGRTSTRPAARRSELYTEPVFYQPAGATDYLPVEVGFRATDDPGHQRGLGPGPGRGRVAAPTSAEAASSPSRPPGRGSPSACRPTARGRLGRQARRRGPRRRLRRASSRGRPAGDRGSRGGHELLRLARGARPSRPCATSWRPRASPSALTDDGTIEARRRRGHARWGSIPRPYAVDSTPDAAQRARDASRTAVKPGPRPRRPDRDRRGRRGMARDRDLPGLRRPPTYYNAGSLSYGDVHTASGYPTTAFHNYVRPDSPYYHELWLGQRPVGHLGPEQRLPALGHHPVRRHDDRHGLVRRLPLPPVLRRPDRRPRPGCGGSSSSRHRATTPGPRPSRPGTTRTRPRRPVRPRGLRGGQHLHLRRGRGEDPRPGLGQRHLPPTTASASTSAAAARARTPARARTGSASSPPSTRAPTPSSPR